MNDHIKKQLIIAHYIIDEISQEIEENDPYTCGIQWVYTDKVKAMSNEELYEHCNALANNDMHQYSTTMCKVLEKLIKLENELNKITKGKDEKNDNLQ